MGDLAAQQWDGIYGAVIGRCGKQPHEPHFANNLATFSVALDADVIHVNDAVNPGPGLGLSDDQQLWPGQKIPNFVGNRR